MGSDNARKGSVRERTAKGAPRWIFPALFLALALEALAGTPASARPANDLPVTGDAGPYILPPDPCWPEPQVTRFDASPASVALGHGTTLSWSVEAPDGCNYGVWVDAQAVAREGTMDVLPPADKTYMLQLSWGPSMVHTAWATIPVSVGLPSVVTIEDSSAASAALLIEALKTPDTSIRLGRNVDMDLSAQWSSLYVAHGVSLTSDHEVEPQTYEPWTSTATSAAAFLGVAPAGGSLAGTPASAGSAGPSGIGSVARLLPPGFGNRPTASWRSGLSRGPRLYTNQPLKPLFTVSCDPGDAAPARVRFSGFRLQGPHQDSEESNDFLEQGIHVNSCNGVEISNMEIFGWSGAAVAVDDRYGNQIGHPDALWVHDNYIHHNQHIGGNGYGVSVSAAGHALVERNVFDWNRHAIQANGAARTSYIARRNLVLRGGGYHGRWYMQYIQQFDAHGDDNCYGGDDAWNCGHAGESFEFAYNAFQYTAADAIHIRGEPRTGASIHDNVFAHDSVGDAVELQTPEHVTVGPNTAGFDSFGKYGVCDFDGDGRDDLFLATGVSWWTSSAAKMPWTYLKDSNERLEQVALGDFDGDGRCDVFAVHGKEWGLYGGGSQPWKSLGAYGVPFSELALGHFNGGKAMDVFRRAPDGRWSVVTPGSTEARGWRPLARSALPLSALHLGDFDGDGVSDVIAVVHKRWSISRSGSDRWTPLNRKLSDSLADALIADVDGDGRDDVVRLAASVKFAGQYGSLAYGAKWQVSWAGESEWMTPVPELLAVYPSTGFVLAPFAGRFEGRKNEDLMLVDSGRFGRMYSNASGTVSVQNLNAY